MNLAGNFGVSYIVGYVGSDERLDAILRKAERISVRKTTKNITPQLRISMENVFNRKHHRKMKLVDSSIEKDLIQRLKKDLGRS